MFPYSTDRELQRTPWATISLIALCTIVETLCLIRPELRAILALNPHAFHLWQPFTAMFAHANPLHLIVNMLFLWVFGSHAEDVVGIPRYLLIYVTAGLAGNWLQPMADQVFLHEMRGLIGASGAIMGIVALFAIRFRNTKVNFFYWVSYLYSGTFQIPALWVGVMYLVLDMAEGLATGSIGAASMVANFGHVGGFICGVGWGYGLRLPAAATVDEQMETAAGFAAGGAFEAAGAAMEEALTRDPDNPELWMRAARYYAQKPMTRSRAVPLWGGALQLWLRQGQEATALEHWRRVLQEFAPEAFAPDLLLHLGTALERTGELPEAIRTYGAALHGGADDPRLPATALRLADLCLRQGDPEGARQWYTHLAEHWPQAPEALEVPGRLQAIGEDELDIQLL